MYTLIDRRDHPGGWLAKFKCEIREIREISPPSSAGLPNKMSAKSAISAKSPPLTAGMPMLCGSGAMLGNFSGRISMDRTLSCLCWNRSHIWTSSAELDGWACPSYVVRLLTNGAAIGVGECPVCQPACLSGLGWPQAAVR